jgi:hypothetical protein
MRTIAVNLLSAGTALLIASGIADAVQPMKIDPIVTLNGPAPGLICRR